MTTPTQTNDTAIRISEHVTALLDANADTTGRHDTLLLARQGIADLVWDCLSDDGMVFSDDPDDDAAFWEWAEAGIEAAIDEWETATEPTDPEACGTDARDEQAFLDATQADPDEKVSVTLTRAQLATILETLNTEWEAVIDTLDEVDTEERGRMETYQEELEILAETLQNQA